ncbi:hypothetical protein [Haloferax larsenii]|uniref:Uncharacterized protein n=1 Tax=Haloferax larsenii TaxID=302484 RepID=A0A1H7N229_HALLR|nr:hypothetical protein [Haloferax larsenii]SEL17068.1 hypothetical protein SAMN04488691_103157 [Haloferax larsenii]
MSDGKIVGSDGPGSEAVEDLVRALPAYFPKDESSGNYKLLDVVGEAIDRLDNDITTVDKAMSIQDAEKSESIDRIADAVGIKRRAGESLEKYRTRVLIEFQSLTSEGTLSDLFISFASILNADEEDFWFQDWADLYGSDSRFAFLVPYQKVQDSVLEPSDIPTLADKLAPAGKEVEAQYNGSFRPVSAADYQSGNYQQGRGFGTLDGNGDPAESGGTFGGLIQ